jgi:hypothetical protein
MNTVASKELGVNVWWTVPGLVVDAGIAQDTLLRNGFQKDLMKTPSRRLEISRAAYSLQNRRGKSDRRVTEKTQDNGKYIVFGILDRKRVDDERVRFGQGTTVRLDKDTGAVTAEGSLAKEFYETLAIYEGKITDDDIRLFLRHVIKASKGISKRPSGGIYFVPSDRASMIERAQKVLKELESHAKVYVEGIIDGPRERENVWESVEAEIDSCIEDALKSTERIEKSAKAVQSHKLKLEGLEELMEVYQNLLGEEAKYEAVAERIEIAVGEVQRKMSELQAAQATRVKKVKTGKSRGSKVVEAAVAVLKEAGESLDFRELTERAITAGLYEGNCKDPIASFNSVLSKAITAGETRIVRVRRGWYGLAA